MSEYEYRYQWPGKKEIQRITRVANKQSKENKGQKTVCLSIKPK